MPDTRREGFAAECQRQCLLLQGDAQDRETTNWLAMKRGDVVTVALQSDLGKPRPALVIQSDLCGAHPSVTILPVTSDVRALSPMPRT